MSLRHFIPSPALAPFVRTIWLYDKETSVASAERLMPDGRAQIIVTLGDGMSRVKEEGAHEGWQTFRGPVLAGPRSSSTFIDPSSMATVIGIHFYAGRAAPFIGAPMSDVTGRTTALEQLWGSDAADLRSELDEASTPEAKCVVFESYMLRHLDAASGSTPAVDIALKAFQTAPSRPIANVVDHSGLSASKFIDLFRSRVGLAPKRFRRVLRVQKALSMFAFEPRRKSRLRCALLRLLRPGALHTRLSLGCGYDAARIHGRPHSPPESRLFHDGLNFLQDRHAFSL